MTSYFNIDLLEVAMHQVKLSDEAGVKFTTVLTEELMELSPGDKTFLSNRFVRALSRNARPIRERDPGTDLIPNGLREIWADKSRLLDMSASMAEHLALQQPLSSLPGLMVVATARVAREDGILVAKVEHQEAMKIEPSTNERGRQVFHIERLRELVFGEGSRVYKIAFFSKALAAQGLVAGDIADVQNGADIANYFLAKFLGCTLREDPSVVTEQLFNGLAKAINSSGLSGEEAADVYSALVTEVKSNRVDLDPRRFIQDHVPPPHQAEVARQLESNGSSLVPVRKDASLISSQLVKARIIIDDVVIQAPVDQVGEGLPVEVRSEGQHEVVEIRGTKSTIRPTG